MRAAVMLVGLALAAGPAWAAEEPAPAEKADKDKVICKERTKVNSRFTTRQCMTKAEWDQQTETARSAFAQIYDRPMVVIYPPSGNGGR